MPSTITLHKESALKAIDALFATTSAAEAGGIEALEEIKERCVENIDALREQSQQSHA